MRVVAVLTLLALVASAAGEQFWCEYDASAGLFPEDAGWTRITYGGGAQRSFEDGALVLDGLADLGIEDFYRMDAPLQLQAGECFVLRWRMRADQVFGFADPGMNFTVLGQAALTLVYTESSIYSLGEGVSTVATFEPGVFHDYQVTSTDLDTYTLQIDGEDVHYGLLDPTGWESGVQWGDYVRGGRSLAHWDYVQFGVIPEPTSGVIMGLLAPLLFLFRGPTKRGDA
jgi:hypothetical protein